MAANRKDDDARLLRNFQVAAFFGVTVMTIDNWARHPTLNFPEGRDINGIRYRDREELVRWGLTSAKKFAERPRTTRGAPGREAAHAPGAKRATRRGTDELPPAA